MEQKHKIFLDSLVDYVEASHGQNLLTALLRAKVRISNSCGGSGSCGTCRVIVVEDSNGLSPRTELENEMSQDRGFSENERLSCQAFVVGHTKIKIPSQSI